MRAVPAGRRMRWLTNGVAVPLLTFTDTSWLAKETAGVLLLVMPTACC